ncbi:glucose-6-phosphate dehydrogenase assembly protein OpcA [Agromyces mariniharenae]|uniref:Glucose-6-phosphate dehydrogenase assembly protein OpcA n=1 Tax=Agromyces mariniharenae TaxID=2604423 RepID=A0A5S4UW72_9MICO|nr:glucose-6-phosphate dehydrogenase assembly protein OpcA [Agromyces mariniharenae]TYL50826.1 glucose-6-phosphate dehydrogenase assembly protein OpcA [Agromyces mariniharenae]
MIVELPDTTTSQVSKTLVKIREEGGVVALGRVLTLVIATAPGSEEEAIEAANDASREHPMRVIVVSSDPEEAPDLDARLDAEIRVGGDAGASEVIVLRAHGDAARDEESLVMGLLLPDAPVVTWWPGASPDVPGQSPLGRIAHRRITDASTKPDPQHALHACATSYTPGDADFAWTRLTLWRAQLAAVLDQPPYAPITAVKVTGAIDSPSTTLLAAWLHLQLDAPTTYELTPVEEGSHGIHGVELQRDGGTVELVRDIPGVATLNQPGQPTHHVALPRRNLRDCLADELRRLDPDELYGEVITSGLALLGDAEAEGVHA